MNPVHLVIGIHNHQPVGNFDFVFEETFRKSYLPFFECLERHPHIRLAMHYSGILLEWIQNHHPDYVERLKNRVQSGQIEMIGGGYYEPILSVIPENDRLGQIKKLSGYIRRLTGSDPEGLWCAERIWEPQLAGTLNRAGIQYSILDDTHFKCTGLRDEDLTGYFLTEELGLPLRLFPISARLRYTIPFQEPDVTIEVLRHISETGENAMLVFADDGEKFGSWPGTYDHVFTNGWLERFFRTLEDNREWIRLTLFKEAIRQLPPKGRVYLPTASYMEMMQWTLPARGFQEYEDFENRLKESGLWDQYGIYVRGGFWRSFLTKYPESNQMHKKMIHVSRKLAEAQLSGKNLNKARDLLWAGQCNCPYWHGVFGGLYLPHLRHANFKALIHAEAIIDRSVRGPGPWVHSEIRDINMDGHDEILMENDRISACFSPIGGSLIELDDRKSGHNYLNLMTRREEGYHRKLKEKQKGAHEGVASIHDIAKSKEEGLDRYLITDPYPRTGWIDHFFGEETGLDSFSRSQVPELGDFLKNPYKASLKKKKEVLELDLSRDGNVKTGGRSLPVRVRKTFRLRAGSPEMSVIYEVVNLADCPIGIRFGIENGFAFHAGGDPARSYRFNGVEPAFPLLNSIAGEEGIREVSLQDDWMQIGIRIESSLAASVWRFPLETVSLSESGFERVFQGSVILMYWNLELNPGGAWHLELVERLENKTGSALKKS